MTKRERKNIYVYADWKGLKEPNKLMGALSADVGRGTEVFSFSYDDKWIDENDWFALDPDLQLYTGPQHTQKSNFGVFTDSCPDRWGRTLMDRREAILARQEKREEKKLFESDYLLGVYDGHRMGGIRFKTDTDGAFLNDNEDFSTPPWVKLRELEQASLKLEEAGAEDSPEYSKWLNMLISPGSSLGGARPKASVVDETGQLWIAKFPSQKDDNDIGAWEMLVYKIATMAGVQMSECRLQKFSSNYHTFMTKRFDREAGQRIHFSSAMTSLGKTDGDDGGRGISYIHLAEFISRNGSHVNQDLEQLWTRIVFNICVSNVDDHLRNHGFLLNQQGWRLSPAYDLNPVRDGNGLKLNISEKDNSQELDLALEVIPHFRLDAVKAQEVITNVKREVSKWRGLAESLGISKSEQERMERAFRCAK